MYFDYTMLLSIIPLFFLLHGIIPNDIIDKILTILYIKQFTFRRKDVKWYLILIYLSNLPAGTTFVEYIIKMLIMFAIGGILIYLAIKKDYEPALLLPIGFGAI